MEHQFKPWQPVIVRSLDDQQWKTDFFSHYKEGWDFPFACTSGSYKYCLPAKGNRHLVGTTDSPALPEPEFKFGDKVEVERFGYHGWFKAVYLSENKDESESRGVPCHTVYSAVHGRTVVARIRHADW